jgi:PAS domain S-box-containing protein
VFFVSTDGQFEYANSAFEAVLGYEPEALLGADGPQQLGESTAASFAELIDVALREHDGVIQTNFRHRDGHNIPTELRQRTLHDLDGAVQGAAGAAYDLRGRKIAEEKLR